MIDWFKYNSEPWNWTLIGWFGAVLVIIGYYLNANEYITSWIVWMIGNAMVAVYSIYKKAYSTAAMSFIITLMNIYGYIRWLS
jgi:nicotinamide riboside transporter PnuC